MRYPVLSEEVAIREKRIGQKFQLRLGTNFPKKITMDSKPLKPSNVWQNLVSLGSVIQWSLYVWEARQ